MNQKNPSATTSSQRPYKRQVRNILIHKPMQREFSLVLVALLMISMLAVGFVIHETIREAAFGGGFRFGKINPYEVLSEVRYQLILRVSCILFVTLVVIGIFSIFFLHRVAGPVYRFRQIFWRLNKGEIPLPIRLREGDFFSETASEINQLLKKAKADQEKSALLREKIEQALSAHPNEEIVQPLREAKSILEQNIDHS